MNDCAKFFIANLAIVISKFAIIISKFAIIISKFAITFHRFAKDIFCHCQRTLFKLFVINM